VFLCILYKIAEPLVSTESIRILMNLLYRISPLGMFAPSAANVVGEPLSMVKLTLAPSEIPKSCIAYQYPDTS
jgi:hypothetical protein